MLKKARYGPPRLITEHRCVSNDSIFRFSLYRQHQNESAALTALAFPHSPAMLSLYPIQRVKNGTKVLVLQIGQRLFLSEP